MQNTLVLLKPDTVERGLVGTVIARFETAGLRITECRTVRPTLQQLEKHYADLKTRNEAAFLRTTNSLQNKCFIAMIVTGPNAIRKVRALTGPTDPLAAPAGTIRGDFSSDSLQLADAEARSAFNLVHAADCETTAAAEIAIWFGMCPEVK